MIRKNLQKVQDEIASVCQRIGRNPQEITLVAITKNASAQAIQEAINCGITDIGENRIQEAQKKYKDISAVKFHLVGHLQTNKVKEAVKIFNLIHSVDSLKVAVEIDKEAAKINKVQDILIQVNTSQEASKFGLNPDGIVEIIKKISQLPNIHISGLMTIAPLVDNPGKTRPFFRQLRELRDRLNKSQVTSHKLQDLSMGMTNDYQVAIEEGANILRIGRAIFEG